MLRRIRRFILRRDEELENLAWLISVIDSFRVGMGVNMEGLRERIRKLQGPLRMENWPQVYKDMKAIIDLPFEKEPRIKTYMNIFVFLRFLTKEGFLIVGFILFIFLLSMQLLWITSRQFQYMVYGVVAFFFLASSTRSFVTYRMKNFYYHHQNDYRKNEERLQKAAQDLISKMGKQLTEKGENPKKYSFHLYQKDYDGIVILKHPGMLRDFYTVAAKKR